MSTTIRSGGLTTKDSGSAEFFILDWDAETLAASVTISTSTWSISGPDSVLTSANASILTGDRKTQVKLSAGTAGAKYTVTNQIVTNESPSQTLERSFKVLIEEQ